MKVTYTERIQTKTALSQNMFCPSCGGHEYCISEILDGNEHDKYNWYVYCPQCGYDVTLSPTRKIAIKRWKQIYA